MPRTLRSSFLVLAGLALLLAACGLAQDLAGVESAAPELSLINLPLPTPGAEVTPGPVVALVVPPTPTPTPTLAAGEPDAAARIQRGESVYTEHCATCHGADGAGQAPYPALRDNAVVTAAEPTQVIETVLHGRGQMPAFQATLSNQEIAAVVSYIRNAWGNNAAAVTVEQVRTVAGTGEE